MLWRFGLTHMYGPVSNVIFERLVPALREDEIAMAVSLPSRASLLIWWVEAEEPAHKGGRELSLTPPFPLLLQNDAATHGQAAWRSIYAMLGANQTQIPIHRHPTKQQRGVPPAYSSQ